LAHKLGRSYLAADKLLERAKARASKHKKSADPALAEKSREAHERAQRVHASHADRLRHVSHQLGQNPGPLFHRRTSVTRTTIYESSSTN